MSPGWLRQNCSRKKRRSPLRHGLIMRSGRGLNKHYKAVSVLGEVLPTDLCIYNISCVRPCLLSLHLLSLCLCLPFHLSPSLSVFRFISLFACILSLSLSFSISFSICSLSLCLSLSFSFSPCFSKTNDQALMTRLTAVFAQQSKSFF